MGDWAYCKHHGATSVVEEADQATISGGGYGYSRVTDWHVVRLSCGCELSSKTGEHVEHD
jgi:hypothetical protein